MAHDADCVFCRIAAGELPSTPVAESPEAYAFLDIGPIATGHALVIPRTHYETIMEMQPREVAALYALAARVAPALQKAVGAEGLNVLQNNGRCAGQVVRHVHVHLIPRRPGDGIGWPWPARRAEPDELKDLARRIVANLGDA